MNNATNVITTELLHEAYKECNTKEKKEMFFSLLFSIGDITNRHHNVFGKKKIDNGGNANRNAFDVILNWMWHGMHEQFIKFLNAGLFNQYQCFDTLFKSRIKTNKGKVVTVHSVFADEQYCTELLAYVVKIIQKGSTFDKMLVAKFLTLPRLSKRKGHKKMLPETKLIMDAKVKFLVRLSKIMCWEYQVQGNICNFKGYRKWRKLYNTNLESVLFSTGKINEFDEAQFLQWFDQLPALARQRVMMRVGKSAKWTKFIPWIAHWKTFKEEKQKEQRVLEEKVRQGTASLEDKVKLEQVKKEAKVTTGAVTFNELYRQIIKGSVDELKLEAFVQNKVNMPYDNLVIIDGSGSMTGEPYNFAAFLAAVCLCKNPDDDARSMIGVFSNETVWYTHIDKELEAPRQMFRRAISRQVAPKPFVNPELSFLENYRNISGFCQAVFNGGYTDISSLFRSIAWAVENNSQVIDGFKQYPVWTIISDGE